MPWWIAALNTVVALAGTGFGVVALMKPGLMAPRRDEDTKTRFYPAMYAARAIPLGAAVSIAVWMNPAPAILALLLGVAIIAQLGDAIIGIAYHLPGMAIGAVFAVACHGAALLMAL